MSAADDKARLLRERGQVESPPPSNTTTIKSSSNNRANTGNGNLGGRRNTELPTTGKLTKDRHPYTTTKRSEAPSPDSAGYEKIEKHELDDKLPTNDSTVLLVPPVIDSQPVQRPLESQNPESQSSRSQAATSASKPVGSKTSVKSSSDPVPQSALSEDNKRQDRQIPHDAASGTTDHKDRGNGSRTDIGQAQKSHQPASYSDKVKGPPGPPTQPPTNDSGSSSLRTTPAEGPPPSTQVGSSHASQMTDAHSLESHTDHRGGANLVRRSSNHSPPSRYNIGGIASGISNLLGVRGPTVEISRDEYRQLQREANEFRHVRRELDSVNYYHQRAIGDLRSQTRHLQMIQQDNQRLRERADGLEHELKSVSRKYDEAKSLSDTRGKELVGAEIFLSKADSLSISDLSHKINTLNQEIYQAAASLGDFVVRRREKISEEESKQYVNHVKALLGSGLAKILHATSQNSEEPVNILLVQIIIQALLVGFCAKKIIQWTQDDSANDHFLQALYHEIRSSSAQAVSGRWRALTRGQLQSESDSWRDESFDQLHKILMAASWEVLSPDGVQSFEAKLKAIFKVVLDARTALGEKVTSADIEVSIVNPGLPFNEAFMEDEYAADRQEGLPSPPTVIATTGMGLWKVTAPSSPHDAPGTSKYTKVLSPKVVLESTLIAVLEPPPPPVSKPKRPSKSSARLDEKSK